MAQGISISQGCLDFIKEILPKESNQPIFSESKLLDFELEMGFVTGQGNQLGDPINIDNAEEYIFGLWLRKQRGG